MPLRNLIFDWSGTLADDFAPVLEASNAIFAAYGLAPWSESEFREKFYLPFTEFYQQYLPQATLPELDFHYHRAFKTLQHDIPLLPGAREILSFANESGLKVFLLSTIHPDHWHAQATRLGVDQFFTKAYAGALDKRRTILNLLAEHDLNPQETLFVGDMQHDLETAHHAGVIACGVLTGYDSLAKLKKCHPDLLFADMHGVLAHLRRHLADPPSTERPVATVGALILNREKKALLIRTHKWSDLWGIPGGKIQRGESSEAALRREVMEETGLTLSSLRFVEVQDCIDSEEFFRPAHFLLLNYLAHSEGDTVVLNEEAQTFQWIDPREALKTLPLNAPTRGLIERSLQSGAL
jgi:phosphoglycolate phosphatase-like HAD superfamily hydrolase/ADP-ribose pyrophosphatase YjhB (NUDIX family)